VTIEERIESNQAHFDQLIQKKIQWIVFLKASKNRPLFRRDGGREVFIEKVILKGSGAVQNRRNPGLSRSLTLTRMFEVAYHERHQHTGEYRAIYSIRTQPLDRKPPGS
jgi:hypothetical protein